MTLKISMQKNLYRRKYSIICNRFYLINRENRLLLSPSSAVDVVLGVAKYHIQREINRISVTDNCTEHPKSTS